MKIDLSRIENGKMSWLIANSKPIQFLNTLKIQKNQLLKYSKSKELYESKRSESRLEFHWQMLLCLREWNCMLKN